MKIILTLLFIVILIPGMSCAAGTVRFTSINDLAVVPSNWRHPIIKWEDESGSNSVYNLTVRAGRLKLSLSIAGKSYVFRDGSFDPFLKYKSVSFEVAGCKDRIIIDHGYGPLNDTIIYRLVEGLFNPGQKAIIKSMTLDEGMPESLAEVEGTCIGCHSYSRNTGLLNLKRGSDRRFISETSSAYGDVFQQYSFGEFSFLSISPDGSKAAIVRNSRSMIDVRSNFIEPFDMTYSAGDIEILDLSQGSVTSLPGASDSNFVNDMPSWSPDGKFIVFCRYEPDPGTNLLNPVKLYLVPYNNGRGGEAVPLMKTPPSDYCYFPRFSPDGLFISFVTGDASRGYFARSSSIIRLYSVRRKKLLPAPALNMPLTMNSWHAWSSDSRWIVFSTKRDKNGLTALFIGKIDADGKGHPPVEIAFDSDYKVNLPILVRTAKGLDFGRNLPGFIRSIMR